MSGRAQVLVAGAGPVGTFAAYWLASHGIDVIVAEAGPDCAHDLRASTFHPPTLEMLDELGIAEPIIEHGLRAPLFHFRERQSGEAVEFNLSELANQTRFPYRIQCEQHIMARMLADKLACSDRAKVLFNHRVIAFEQSDRGVKVALETPISIEQLEVDYLIAADGGNSIVRKWLQPTFDGFTYHEKFLCLSTKLELAEHLYQIQKNGWCCSGSRAFGGYWFPPLMRHQTKSSLPMPIGMRCLIGWLAKQACRPSIARSTAYTNGWCKIWRMIASLLLAMPRI